MFYSKLIHFILAGRIRKGPAPVSIRGVWRQLRQSADAPFCSSTWKCHSTTSTTRRASSSLVDRVPHRIYKLPITCYSLSFDVTRNAPRGSMDVMAPPVSFIIHYQAYILPDDIGPRSLATYPPTLHQCWDPSCDKLSVITAASDASLSALSTFSLPGCGEKYILSLLLCGHAVTDSLWVELAGA